MDDLYASTRFSHLANEESRDSTRMSLNTVSLKDNYSVRAIADLPTSGNCCHFELLTKSCPPCPVQSRRPSGGELMTVLCGPAIQGQREKHRLI
jgi:hypothetical protein